MNQSSNWNFDFMIGFGVVTLVALFAWVWWVIRNNPNDTFGEIINKLLLREKVTVFVLYLVAANLGEAWMAASIIPVGEIPPNPLSRFVLHTGMALAGITCGVYLPPHLKLMFTRDAKLSKYTNLTFLNFITAVLLLFGTLMFPYLNLVIIAGGLDGTMLLHAFLTGNKSAIAFANMPYALQASVGATGSHYFMIFLDGVMAAASPESAVLGKSSGVKGEERSSAGKYGKSESVDKNKERKEETILNEFENGIKYLLKRYGYRDDSDLPGMLKTANEKIDSMSESDRFTLADNVHRLKDDIETYDKTIGKSASSDEKSAKNREFENRIYSLFQKSTKGGKGFGIQLKQKGKKGN